jgi:transposase InsO family protein
MRFTAHPGYMSAFERYLKDQGFLHGKSQKRSPWQNGFIERSHRTDNENLFQQFVFTSAEERKYMLKLWEYEYNYLRPHQGLSDRTPIELYLENYPVHAASRNIT